MRFHHKFVHISFSSVWVTEWPPFRKELPTRLTIDSLCILTICYFSYFSFGFEGGIWVLIDPFPGHCKLVTVIFVAIGFHVLLKIYYFKALTSDLYMVGYIFLPYIFTC